MTCRTCKFLDVAPDSRGRIVPRAGNGYACRYLIPDAHGLPHSATRAYGFLWPPIKTRMQPDDGEGCPQHASRKETDQ